MIFFKDSNPHSDLHKGKIIMIFFIDSNPHSDLHKGKIIIIKLKNNIFLEKNMENETSGIKFAEELINEVDEKIKRVYWTNKEIDRYFARRTYQEIIDQKNIGFMNPCSGLTLVTSNLLAQEGIPHQWIIQQEEPTEDFDFQRLHFALTFKYNGKPHTINYIRNNDVYVSEETNALAENNHIIQTLTIPSSKMELDKSVYQNLTSTNFAHYFDGFSLEKVLARLKRDNSPENFKIFRQIHGEKFKITKH